LKFERDRENSYRYRNATLLVARESHLTPDIDQTECYLPVVSADIHDEQDHQTEIHVLDDCCVTISFE